jgi:hypothetical protein
VSPERGRAERTRVPRPARKPAAPARKETAPRAEHPARAPQVGHRFAAVRVTADDSARAVSGALPLLDEPGRPLDRQVGARVGAAYGRDFSGVRVHHGTPGADVASRRSARAVTVGGHVAFAPGEYRPGTVVGDALIAHELAHVVQQEGAAGVAAAPAHGALEADADRAALSALLASQGRERRGIVPALRTGLALQSCSGGSPARTFEEAVRARDYGRAAALLAAERSDAAIMTKLRPLTPDQLTRLDAAAVRTLGAGADRIQRPILFLLHGPAAGTPHTEATVEAPGSVAHAGRAGAGDVEGRTGVRYRRASGGSASDPAFSVGYTGPDASTSRWLQFIWREIVVDHPRRGTYRVNESVRSSARNRYRFTTDPANPVYNTDSRSATNPFYEAGFLDNRSADATTMYDFPGAFKSVVRRQFDAGATHVVSRAHFTTYLVRDMQVLYVITTDLEWVFTSAADDPRPAQSQGGRAAGALDPAMRRKLAEQYPAFAYIP